MTKQMQPRLRHLCWSLVLFLLTAIAARAAGTPIIVTDHGAYHTNEPIKIGFTNGPANAKDWIAIYAETNAPSSDANLLLWDYVDGTHTGAAGKAQGEINFSAGLPAGIYVAYFLEDDGYRSLAKQKFIVQDSSAPFIRADKRIYTKGEKISITFTNGPGNARDKIAIYHDGVLPGSGETISKYVDNANGTTGLTNGTVTFDTGLVIPGVWVAYFLENDTFNPLAQDSFTVIVTSGGVAIQSDHDHYLAQQSVKISFDGGPGNTTDWIGVYKSGQRPGVIQSTDWRYVGGTQNPGAGLTTGAITIETGFFGPQSWVAYFMLNDGYTVVGDTAFDVLDPGAPIVQIQKRVYDLNENIALDFNNAPGNAKDWVGIYKSGETPGVADSIVYQYTDGTHSGTAGIAQGTLTFTNGLSSAGNYTAYLLENDGYNILSSENFTIRSSVPLPPRLLSVSPADGKTNVLAVPDFNAVIENRDTTVVQNSVVVKLDNQVVPNQISTDGSRVTVTATAGSILTQGSQHTYSIIFNDSTGASIGATNTFKIGEVRSLSLPAPLFLETFDTTAEGSIPAGWSVTNNSDPTVIDADLHHLGSLAYENFTVVSASRLAGSFLTYFDSTPETAPIAQITGPSSASYIVNGAFVRNFIKTNALVGISGYHSDKNQILEAATPSYNLSGKSDIYLSFHSLLEQNQDSIAGIELSADAGATWSPVIYYLDPSDMLTNTDGLIDVDITYSTVHNDVARFQDGSGGYYGAFLKAPLDSAVLAATQPRFDDDPGDGTRIELIRIPAADNKPDVRFRLFYAGTDSWYFGVDDFGLYSIPAAPLITITHNGSTITLTWPNLPGFVLQSSPSLAAGSWQTVPGVTGNTYSPNPTGPGTYYRLFKP